MPPKRRTSSRQAAVRTPRPSPVPPVIGPGQRLYVLSVPFEERASAAANGAAWNGALRQTVYVGASLPPNLAPYACPDFSWERWLEEELNAKTVPVQLGAVPMTARPHQQVAVERIVAANAVGYRGFVEADDVGLGKTISALVGAFEVAKARGSSNLLVLCPKGVIAHWRRTIAAVIAGYGDPGLRIVVINYDQAKKLLQAPASAASAKRTRTKNKQIAARGRSIVNWDIVLADESHKLKNTSQRSQAVKTIARYTAPAHSAPFVIWMSATIGQNPVELGYLAPLLSQLTGTEQGDLDDFGQWLADHGFCVEFSSRFGGKWTWGAVPADATEDEARLIEARKDRDLARIRQLLFQGEKSPSVRRLPTDIAGWPEVQRILQPIEFTAEERTLYEQAWSEFRTSMRLARKGGDPKGGMVARLRFRQKASLIRVAGVVEQIVDLLENGHQVAVSVQWMETMDAFREALAKHDVPVAEFSGRTEAFREQERFAFQRGERKVILFSVTEGISLHQGEALGDGTCATSAPRTTVVHDPRFSGLDSIQIEGRGHRDGQFARVFYVFGAGTTEEPIVRTLLGRVRSTKQMSGDDVKVLQELEALLDSFAEEPDGEVAGALPPSAGPRVSTGSGLQSHRPVVRAPAGAAPVKAQGGTRRSSGSPAGRVAVKGSQGGAGGLRDALAGGEARQVGLPVTSDAERAALRDAMRRKQ